MALNERSTRLVVAGAGALCLVVAACSPAPHTPSPTSSPTPSATTSPLTTPSPAPTATPVPPGGVPAGFAPNSVTFVSLSLGWVLGGAPCQSGTCLALLRTPDAGRTWTAVQGPPTTYAPATSPATYPQTGVSEVRFADPQDGWAYGPDLWSTHNGGRTWTRTALGSVWSLEAASGLVHAVAVQPDNTVAIETGPANRDAWARTGSLQTGAGPVPSADLVLQGSNGWVIENDRGVIGADRLVSGRWPAWKPPCATTGGPAVLSAPTRSSLVAVCQQGIWGPPAPEAVRVYFSSDGGATFYRRGGVLPGDASSSGDVVASPVPGVVVTDAFVNNSAELVETFNSATSWQTVATISPLMVFTYLGFTSPMQGVALTSGRGLSSLLMTFDGGRRWSTVKF
jgi:hypothetical protein